MGNMSLEARKKLIMALEQAKRGNRDANVLAILRENVPSLDEQDIRIFGPVISGHPAMRGEESRPNLLDVFLPEVRRMLEEKRAACRSDYTSFTYYIKCRDSMGISCRFITLRLPAEEADCLINKLSITAVEQVNPSDLIETWDSEGGGSFLSAPMQ